MTYHQHINTTTPGPRFDLFYLVCSLSFAGTIGTGPSPMSSFLSPLGKSHLTLLFCFRTCTVYPCSFAATISFSSLSFYALHPHCWIVVSLLFVTMDDRILDYLSSFFCTLYEGRVHVFLDQPCTPMRPNLCWTDAASSGTNSVRWYSIYRPGLVRR
ncbi:hypothetical protein OE88DRAFT_424029 [Heliocybe sulcata]|uniref:Uncharacterized protein n=1 Tax=Heliocybe sulcata TaxID=5364 RepID=A0A5C3MVP0_9AGAM|nr:hypothetical protein OE88DRAFT_424029 [Heliocybe sulcata]